MSCSNFSRNPAKVGYQGAKWETGSVKMDILIILLIFSATLAALIWALVTFLDPRHRTPLRERRTAHWPVAAGIIEAFDTRPATRKMITLSLYYSYEVNERFYSGKFDNVYDSFDSAYFVWLRWKGLRIPIRYKPVAPSISFFPEKTWRREQPAGFDRPPAG